MTENGPLSPLDVAVIGVDEAGVIVHASPDVKDLLGWVDEELVGRPLTDLMPERFRRPHLAAFTAFVESGVLELVGRTLHFTALRRDGSERQIELVLSIPSRNDSAAVIGVLRSPERETQRTARELRHELRAVLDANRGPAADLEPALGIVGAAGGWAIVTLWVFDRWWRRLRVAGLWERDLGANESYRQERGDEPAASPHVAAAWRTGAAVERDELADDPDPALRGRDGLAQFHPLRTDDEIVAVLELVENAGDPQPMQRQESLWHLADELARFVASSTAQQALAVERLRLQLALSSRRMGVWIQRIETGEIIWDEQMEKLHGLEPGTFDGSPGSHRHRVHPDDVDSLREGVQQAIEEREPFRFRCRARHEQAGWIWIEGAGQPVLDANGDPVELTGVCYDVTEDVDARRELEDRVRQAALAADVGRAFVDESSLGVKLEAAARAIVRHLDAAFARIWVLPPASDVLELRASAGRYTHLDGAHSRVPVGELKIGRIAASGEPHLTNDVLQDPLVDREWARAEGMVAFAGYPLAAGDRCVGVLGLFAQRRLQESALHALGAIADLVAIGIDRARTEDEVAELHEQTRQHAEALSAALEDRSHVASVLQQSLLPPTLPEIPGMQVAARYQAGIEEVGGDFYDVFPLRSGRWAFMIGDICGRGPEAARLTALARHSLRTALILGREPADALAALNAALLHSDNDKRFCSAVCGVIHGTDSATTAMSIGVAGHPPPVLRRADGTVDLVAGTGTLLGLFPDVEFGQTEVVLETGDSLVLYTDGVTEARGPVRMFGIEGLSGLLRNTRAATAVALADDVLETLARFEVAPAEDDLALVVLRRS